MKIRDRKLRYCVGSLVPPRRPASRMEHFWHPPITETSDKMTSYIISYDLHGPSRDYEKLFDFLEGLAFSARLLESVWLVKSDLNTAALRDALVRHIDSNDSMLVVKSGGSAAWRKLNTPGDVIKGHFG